MLSRHAFPPCTNLLRCSQSRTIASSSTLLQPRKKTATKSHDGEAEVHASRAKPEPRASAKEKEVKPKLEGLLGKQAQIDASIRRRASRIRTIEAKAAAAVAGKELERGSSAVEKLSSIPKSSQASAELLSQGSKNHNNLETFLEYAKKNELNVNTTVYKGTLYEYTVAEVLKGFGFNLHRTGKSNDLGIDLLGQWHLPDKPHELKVLLQCKATKPTPATARELEGAYMGAPTGWQGENVLALLVTTQPSTKGVVGAIQRSKSPVGVLQIDRDGYVRQFLWNSIAGERGLAGLGVTARYTECDKTSKKRTKVKKELVGTIALTWMGNPWRKAPAAPAIALAKER